MRPAPYRTGYSAESTPRILGVDPGLTGGIALLTGLCELTVADMPIIETERAGRAKRSVNAPALAWLIREFAPSHAIVERVGAMPGQGVSSMFSFGRSLGVIEGVLAALGIPVSYVAPRVWQSALSVRAGKDGSRARACELLPAYAERFGRRRDDGRADAALLALWGLLHGQAIANARRIVDEVAP